MKIDLNEIATAKVTPEGVQDITVGAIITSQMREGLRQFLKAADPEGYAEYRQIRYPSGPESATDETRRASVEFIFNRVGKIAATHYVSTL